jgi:hypothetical protein
MHLEAYLAQPEYLDLIRDMLADFAQEERDFDDRSKAAVRTELGKKSQADIEGRLRSLKTAYAARIADALARHPDATRRVPQLIKQMLDFIQPPRVNSTLPGAANGSQD